jgi:hypothetical protein
VYESVASHARLYRDPRFPQMRSRWISRRDIGEYAWTSTFLRAMCDKIFDERTGHIVSARGRHDRDRIGDSLLTNSGGEFG